MQKLPLVSDSSRMQTIWKGILDTLLSRPLSDANMLTGVAVSSGDNVINHRLGRTPQGWFITDVNASVTVYRSAAFNDLTLTLNSSGSATISLMVF